MTYGNEQGGVSDDGVEISRTAEYRLAFAENGLDFRPITIADPIPIGRQILERAGIREVERYALISLLANGAMEDIRLGETYDLRGRGSERVIAFLTDTLYRAFLQGQDMLWGRKDIRGAELNALAVLREGEALYLEVPGGADIVVKDDSVFDLAAPGVERFITGPAHVPPGFEVSVNFNGLVRRVRVVPDETIAQVIAAVRPLFGNPGGDLILIDMASGRELDPGHTVKHVGVHPDANLQLRPRTVQGG